ncbi:MAG TPA: L-threonylcarbamoyladenylate synthase [Candidatus Binatia bacterium]|nr:L-threonylcarbamoyladenylate synthase [Candidatus Binatia bacterium]
MSRNETENSRAKKDTIENFSGAVAALRRGDVIVYPTETLYGLGADAFNQAAVEQVFRLKDRDSHNPISVLIADREMLHELVPQVSPAAENLMAEFWPGPLTLVLPARKGIPKPLLNATGGIGVRISSQPIASRLVEALRRPLTATSANPSGKEPARTVEEAKGYFRDEVKVFLDGGLLRSKRGSTVVEMVGKTIKIIREGEIAASQIRHILGDKRR